MGTRGSKKQGQRTGRPFTLYLPLQQAEQLEQLAKKRSVAKATLVKFAIDRLLTDLTNGQLVLPLGIQ
jgi:predicted DNA-binding protein